MTNHATVNSRGPGTCYTPPLYWRRRPLNFAPDEAAPRIQVALLYLQRPKRNYTGINGAIRRPDRGPGGMHLH
jgi:hypothetical protein